MIEAVPLLRIVVSRYPNDPVARERLGVALVSKADVDSDPEKSKEDRIEAREQLLKAKTLGDNSDLMNTLLQQLPENGERRPFSDKGEVDAAMRRGEAAFAQAKWDDAIREYTAAYNLDPTLYSSALDIGDAYFRLAQINKAGEWFGKAIQIDPNRETAYRYWGDALLQAGNMIEARSKYIQGIAASPYAPGSWYGINNWLRLNHASLRAVNVRVPTTIAPDGKSGITINLDASAIGKDDGGSAWLMYSIERASWRQQKFAKEFPNEKAYRHCLKEEVDALSLTVNSYNQQKKDHKVKHPDAGLELLSQIQADDMLAPYVLLVKADAGIASDFSAYQAEHRDEIFAFLNKYVVPPAGDFKAH